MCVLGALKNGSVFCPLFSAFGPEPIHARMSIGDARVLLTTESLYQRKVAPLRDQLPQLQHVILIGDRHGPTMVPGTLDYIDLMANASANFQIEQTDPQAMALLHFTSGTTDLREKRPVYKRYPMAVVFTIAGGLTIAAALIVSVLGQVYGYQIADEIGLTGPAQALLPLVRYPVVILLVFVAVTALYWLSPAERLPLRWMLPGSLLFVVVWLIASFVFGAYVSGFASYGAIYGALGGVVITLIWFYITALVLLFGAEVNAVVLREFAPEQLPVEKLEREAQDSATSEARDSGRRNASQH